MIAIWMGSLVLAASLNAADVTAYVQNGSLLPAFPAQNIATGIFGKAGVTIAWKTGVPRGDSPGLVLLVDLEDRTPDNLLPKALGFSCPYRRPYATVQIFVDRIRLRTRQNPGQQWNLMGHVLVHEISHVIQGVDRHSPSGIMKGCWDRDDYAAMVNRTLFFEEDDVFYLHQGLLVRNQQKASTVRRDGENVSSGKIGDAGREKGAGGPQ